MNNSDSYFMLPAMLLSSGFFWLFAILPLALYVGSILWCISDGNYRGKNGCLVGLLVALLSWPIGLLLWLIFRPDPIRVEYPPDDLLQEDDDPEDAPPSLPSRERALSRRDRLRLKKMGVRLARPAEEDDG
jgi:hypothetical protein